MNYDLCDLLNKKMENLFDYYPKNYLNKSIFKHSDFIESLLEKKHAEEYLKILEVNEFDSQAYAFWVYRNGTFSNQINDFEISAKKITRELANLTYSNNPSVDIMYFSGVLKMIYTQNKCLYIETCTKPTLDQLMSLKDFEKKILEKSGIMLWKIVDRKNKNKFYEGIGLESLFGFNWSKVK